MKIMQYTPIIVLVVLALGIAAVKVYWPHGAVRIYAIGGSTTSLLGSTRFAAARFTVASAQEVV